MKKQKGFSTVEALLLLIILIILILLGWYVWNQQKNNSNGNDSSNQPATEQASKPEVKNQKTYLEIKEWGVRITLSDSTKTAYYNIRASVEGDPGEYADIFDKDFDGAKNSKGVACKDASFPLFVVARYKNGAVVEDQTVPDLNTLPLIAGYRYSGTGSHQAYPTCYFLSEDNSQTDANVLKTYETKRDALETDYKTLEATP